MEIQKIVRLASGTYGEVYYINVMKDSKKIKCVFKVAKRGAEELKYEKRIHKYIIKNVKTMRYYPKIIDLNKKEEKTILKEINKTTKKMYKYGYGIEYIQGQTLRQVYENKTEKELMSIYRKMYNAYKTLWDIGVVHGDAHLGNTIVTRNGGVKIIDFGMATKVERPGKNVDTPIEYFEWFKKQWPKVLKFQGIEKGNPNTAHFNMCMTKKMFAYTHADMLCKIQKLMLYKTKQQNRASLPLRVG